jgi:hypothetical protein
MLAFGSSRFARVRYKISRILCPPLLTWHSERKKFISHRGNLALLTCCKGLPHITEQELLAGDFITTSLRAKA